MRHDEDDPILHTAMSDSLPSSHPWAESYVHCARCGVMIHANNNEMMRGWLEWRGVALCCRCAAPFLTDLRDFYPFLDVNGDLLSMNGKVS